VCRKRKPLGAKSSVFYSENDRNMKKANCSSGSWHKRERIIATVILSCDWKRLKACEAVNDP
jgi:hypothetical protein